MWVPSFNLNKGEIMSNAEIRSIDRTLDVLEKEVKELKHDLKEGLP